MIDGKAQDRKTQLICCRKGTENAMYTLKQEKNQLTSSVIKV